MINKINTSRSIKDTRIIANITYIELNFLIIILSSYRPAFSHLEKNAYFFDISVKETSKNSITKRPRTTSNKQCFSANINNHSIILLLIKSENKSLSLILSLVTVFPTSILFSIISFIAEAHSLALSGEHNLLYSYPSILQLRNLTSMRQ